MPEAQTKVEFSPALAAVKVQADRDKLKQFINIVRNACGSG